VLHNSIWGSSIYVWGAKSPWRRDGMKVRSVVVDSNLSAFRCTSVTVVRWTDVLLSSGYKMGVSIWADVHSHSMGRWALSGADVMASWDGMAETVWLFCDEALGCWMPASVVRLSAGIGRWHPVTVCKGSLIAASMRQVWALRHQTGVQYSAVESNRLRWPFATLLFQHPSKLPQECDAWYQLFAKWPSVLSNIPPKYVGSEQRAGFRCCGWYSAYLLFSLLVVEVDDYQHWFCSTEL